MRKKINKIDEQKNIGIVTQGLPSKLCSILASGRLGVLRCLRPMA